MTIGTDELDDRGVELRRETNDADTNGPDFLAELPKALADYERANLAILAEAASEPDAPAAASVLVRVLPLIDALTAHLAEAMARMTVAEANLQSRFYCRYCDEGTTCELYTELETERKAALARAEAAERNLTRVRGHIEKLKTQSLSDLESVAQERNDMQDARDKASEERDHAIGKFREAFAAKERAESEAAALRAERDQLGKDYEKATAEASTAWGQVHALRAENELLRAGYNQLAEGNGIVQDGLEGQLDAANALLVRADRFDPKDPNALVLVRDIREYVAHLDGRPAAPTAPKT